SSHIDRSVSADDSELSVESLIENLKNMIMKELSVSCVTESLISSLASSAASFSAASLSVPFSAASQSSTLVPVSDSPALTISVPATPTPTTPGFTVSAFITSSLCFKEMLHRLSELYLSFLVAPVSEAILIKDDNATETISSHSQASFIAFSLSSVRKVVCTLSC
ncbi:hypothetical protein BDFG_08830, partial [Blastomyces dermatitidis ATCC 26199]